jgi:hypothetical protein
LCVGAAKQTVLLLWLSLLLGRAEERRGGCLVLLSGGVVSE